MDEIAADVIVVGAGVVGLAVARALAEAGRAVVVLEAERSIGTGISSRNSEVIHSGLYYAPGSLKATLCVEGRRRLYAYCAARGIAHRRCGKLVVANDRDDMARLEALRANGLANGVDDLVLLDEAEIRRLEPALACAGSLFSPSTGIVDSHALMQALRADLETAGGTVCLETPVVGGDVGSGLRLRTGGRDPASVIARSVVVCAGLSASALVRGFGGMPQASIAPTWFAKGSYFALAGPSPFQRLVYPLPEPGGLGVHATLDLAGATRFGPDVEWVADATDFRVDPARRGRFAAAIRRYWPGLPEDALTADYAGIRPKRVGPGEPAADFGILGPRAHGVAGFVVLVGIESPGLTASLAIAAHVAALVEEA